MYNLFCIHLHILKIEGAGVVYMHSNISCEAGTYPEGNEGGFIIAPLPQEFEQQNLRTINICIYLK